MMRYVLLGLLCKLTLASSFGQFTDDFGDGDFISAPPWYGSTSDFIVNSGKLQLSAGPGKSTAYLFTSSVVSVEAEWKCSIRLDFNPSSSNYAELFLMSDQKNPDTALTGYFIKIGGSNDEVSLYRRDGLEQVVLIDGQDGVLDTGTVDIGLRVVRNKDWTWELYREDMLTSGGYVMEGRATDSTYRYTSSFGLRCQFTSTRSDKFSFDDFRVTGNRYRDPIAPYVKTISVLDARTIFIVFSEIMDSLSVLPEFFSVMTTTALNVKFMKDGTAVEVVFPRTFPHGRKEAVNIHSVRDTTANQMKPEEHMVLYNDSALWQYKEIIISELMINPVPGKGLPGSEYIEIYNRGDHWLNIGDWKITDKLDTARINDIVIGPQAYAVIIDKLDEAKWQAFTNVIAVDDLPTLNNDEDDITLISASGKRIDDVAYRSSWYGDKTKDAGGWSLEIRDPDFLCSYPSNWIASNSLFAGTPGYRNSVMVDDTAYLTFEWQRLLKLTDTLIRLEINGWPDKNAMGSKTIPLVSSLKYDSVAFISDTVLAISGKHFRQHAGKQTVAFYDFADCAGRNYDESLFEFMIPDEARMNDVVINEILFNPLPGGVDFVEIYNPSLRHIDLDGWQIGTFRTDGSADLRPIADRYFLLQPGAYAALTKDPDVVRTDYYLAPADRIFPGDLPSYPDKSGTVVLTNTSLQLMDQFNYDEHMHISLLGSTEGISLERISASLPTNMSSNWHSASSLSGNATPGFKNSQSAAFDKRTADFYVDPGIFSPDNDGLDDYTAIHYSIPEAGMIGTAAVYDEKARNIRRLLSNEILEHTGTLIWDGIQDNGLKATAGYYIVFLEAFSESGKKWKRKTTVVLAHHK